MYAQRRRQNHLSLGDTPLLSGKCPARKDTLENAVRQWCNYCKLSKPNLVCHFRNKFVKVSHRFVNIHYMGPFTFDDLGTVSAARLRWP